MARATAEASFMPLPTTVPREHHVFGLSICPSGRCPLTPFYVTQHLCTLWRDFNETWHKWWTMWKVIAEKVFRIRGQWI